MHIPFYTALKWWAPGSLPTYLNQPQPKEAGERRRAEAGWPDWGRGARAGAAGWGAGSSPAHPCCCPVCVPRAGVSRDGQVQWGHTSVPVAALAYCSPLAQREPPVVACHAPGAQAFRRWHLWKIFTPCRLCDLFVFKQASASPRRDGLGKGRRGLTALSIFRKTCRVCTSAQAPWSSRPWLGPLLVSHEAWTQFTNRKCHF